MSRKYALHALITGTLALAACSQDTGREGKGTVSLTPCKGDSPTARALSAKDARCGKLTVFENRKTKKGPTIDLNIAVIPALAKRPKPDPLFILAGGPGQAATEAGAMMMPFFKKTHQHRDIVLVDQRGTGASNPLDCTPDEDLTLADLFRADPIPGLVEKCVAEYDADLRQYTTDIAMDDLDQVRSALGYDKINLWGGSYGTRAALVYLRRHGETVRSAVLDGAVPLTMRLPSHFAEDAEGALLKLFEDCQADPSCNSAFGDIHTTLKALLGSLDKAPAQVTVHHPRTGAPTEISVTRASVSGILLGALYTDVESAIIPLAVNRAAKGDFSVLAALAEIRADIGEMMSFGMQLAVLCNEDLSRIADAGPAGPDAGTETDGAAEPPLFSQSELVHNFKRHCRHFPPANLPDSYFEPVASDVPALVLSGELDPVTPPRWGKRAAEHLSNSVHLVVPGVGHGTTATSCISRVVSSFIDRGSAVGLDTKCAANLKRSALFLGNTGPVQAEKKND